MTTRLSSCARQGLARVVTTLVVCGGLPLLIHALAAPGSDPLVSAFAAVCGVAAEAPAPPIWLNEPALDSPDSFR